LRRWILSSLDLRFIHVLLMQSDGLRVREIAGALGPPPGTVKRRLQLARKNYATHAEISEVEKVPVGTMKRRIHTLKKKLRILKNNVNLSGS
jgi:DNA-directed RNA polymerase specialized sigma24 family protein